MESAAKLLTRSSFLSSVDPKNITRAIEFYEEAIRIYNPLPKFALNAAKLNIAIAKLIEKTDLTRCFEYMMNASKIACSLPMNSGKDIVHSTMDFLFKHSKLDKALELAQTVLKNLNVKQKDMKYEYVCISVVIHLANDNVWEASNLLEDHFKRDDEIVHSKEFAVSEDLIQAYKNLDASKLKEIQESKYLLNFSASEVEVSASSLESPVICSSAFWHLQFTASTLE